MCFSVHNYSPFLSVGHHRIFVSPFPPIAAAAAVIDWRLHKREEEGAFSHCRRSPLFIFLAPFLAAGTEPPQLVGAVHSGYGEGGGWVEKRVLLFARYIYGCN